MSVVSSQRESGCAQIESASGKARERVGREIHRTRRRSSNAGHGGVAMAALSNTGTYSPTKQVRHPAAAAAAAAAASAAAAAAAAAASSRCR